MAMELILMGLLLTRPPHPVEDDVDELPDSYFSKDVARVFDKIDNGKDGARPSSKFFNLIETLGEGFYNVELAGHLRKVEPNESGSLENFDFVRWYVEKEVSLEPTEEAERLVSWGCKVSLMDLQ